MTDIVERLRERARVGDGWTRPDAAEAADEIERLRDIEAAYDLNQKNSYRAIMMWEEAHSKRASGIHEVDLLTWLLDEVDRLRAALALGIHMREAQTTYFKTRSRDALIASKTLEKEFLDRARALLKEGEQ